MTLITGSLNVQTGGEIDSNVTIQSPTVTIAGAIVADALGYIGVAASNGNGIGGGSAPGSMYGGGGGGHGGAGGAGTGGAGGATYDSTTNPTMSGSAGGGTSFNSATGGAGGGVIRIIASGTVNISGATLHVNGAVGTLYASGGGAGGSIYISAATLTSSGGTTLRANGAAGNSALGNPYVGGGGGGGIIATTADVAPSGTIQVNGGTAVSTAVPGASGVYTHTP